MESINSKNPVRLARPALTALFLLAGTALPLPGLAAPGDVTDNSGLIPFNQAYFAFEVESPLGSLTGDPLWNEVEMLLDNPYAIYLDPSTGGNYQDYPSYRSLNPRRRSFHFRLNGDTSPTAEPCAPGSEGCVEVPLSDLLVHPLNYMPAGGEECRLLNMTYEGGPWQVPDGILHLVTDDNQNPDLGPLGVAVYEYHYVDIVVSPGEDRIEEDEAGIDFNSPQGPDTPVCIQTAEALVDESGNPVPEGSIICGADPGEPGYLGFGVLGDLAEQYSIPCVPGSTKDSVIGLQLFDPARGIIETRDPETGTGVDGGPALRKPSLRIAEVGGTGSAPNYAFNSEASLAADPAALAPSNENDYVMDRDIAVVLGKALFWDMQVGSDGVQACGTCHFNVGADARTRNQLNPNHLGGDLTLQVAGPNMEVMPGDFPFHKRFDPDAVGDGLLNPGLVASDANDVMSSMGVSKFKEFVDVPVGPAAFGPVFRNARPLLPDIGNDVPDPIPVFQPEVIGDGIGNDDGICDTGEECTSLRRVEPRNTPTMIGAALNFDNFWDGRARHDFNGGSVFGPSDPSFHVYVNDGTKAGRLAATRQIIRFSSLASQAVGPPLSEFEMSFLGRNWAKIGKKMLQAKVKPLANQLVDPDDSVLGPYSRQRQGIGGPVTPQTLGRPGLHLNYKQLIRRSFYPQLWANRRQHLEGAPDPTDPFDGYSLAIARRAADPLDTNQFTQMEANFSLFFGLSVQLYEELLIPDDAPVDRFFDANPDTFAAFGESGEPFLVLDLLNCGTINPITGLPQEDLCFTESGSFKRDQDVIARIGCTVETGADCVEVPAGGTREAGAPDPLQGLDFFLGSNLSLKNPNFRSLRCGECHAGGELTDHTFGSSHAVGLGDWVAEFVTGQPGHELFPEPLGRGRIISGFLLESEINENAQDALERNIADFCVVEPCVDLYGNPVPTSRFEGGPQGQALFDNGMYNIGLRPISEDVLRGGDDPFGFPLSLAYLALQNLGGVDYSPGGDDPLTSFNQPPSPGIPLPNFDPAIDPAGGGLFGENAQDQQINPGFEEEPLFPLLPPYLAPWANHIPVGDESNIDELFVGLNTLVEEPILEGFVDAFGPFNPAAVVGESFNMARQPEMATWPNVNRVNVQGAAKPPSLRLAAFTGPSFHTGSYLTMRQVVDFYMRGGDFPLTNKHHRDFLIANLDNEDEALGGCVDSVTGAPVAVSPDGTCPAGSEAEFTEAEKEEIVKSVVDFLLELPDERVLYQRAPFDQPEIFVPVDGTAPENTFGRQGLMADARFMQVTATGQGGLATPVLGFLGVERGDRNAPNCDSAAGPISHYCQEVQ